MYYEQFPISPQSACRYTVYIDRIIHIKLYTCAFTQEYCEWHHCTGFDSNYLRVGELTMSRRCGHEVVILAYHNTASCNLECVDETCSTK